MTLEIRKDGALIESFKPGYYGCDCCRKPGCNCPDTGDTPTPDTGITSIRIIVADSITDSGRASAVFTPASADTSLYFSSSDESIATIDHRTGQITVLQDGVVTFCVEDLYTGLEDCKEVDVYKSVTPVPTGDTGITSITIVVADEITDSGSASCIFTPSSADTEIVYSSSDDTIATIDPDTGEIEVLETGFVTFCVEDLLSGLRDCKTVEVIKSENVWVEFVFNVLSTTDPAWIAEDSNYPHYNKMIIDDGPEMDFNCRYTFPTTGIHNVKLRLIHPDNMDRANEIVLAGSMHTGFTHCYLIAWKIPDTIESMSLHMQRRNDMVESITLRPIVPPVLDDTFTYDYAWCFNDTSLFYVPAQSLNAYKTAPGWEKVADRFRTITE